MDAEITGQREGPERGTAADFVVEVFALIYNVIRTLLEAAVSNLFFFWPRRYKDISKDTVLVTGGGKGIGRLIAVEFAKHKPKQIILWGRHEDPLAATAKAVELQGVPCDYMICDVADMDQVTFNAKRVKKEYGGVDILVNNAGIVTGLPVLDCRPSDVKRTVDVNLMAHFWTIKSFMPAMMDNNHGHIVFINSMLGLIGLGGATDYSASKFGMLGLFEGLGLEISRAGKNGVFLTSIHPYQVNTDMFSGAETRFPWLFPPLNKDYVAWKVVNAVCTNQQFCIIPRSMYFFSLLKSCLPYETLLVLQRFMWMDRVIEKLHQNRTGS